MILQKFKKIYQLLNSRQKNQLIYMQILALVTSTFEVFGIISIAPFIGIVLTPNFSTESGLFKIISSILGTQNRLEFTVALGAVVFILIVAGNVLNFFTAWYQQLYGGQFARHLSVQLYRSYLGKPYIFHAHVNSSLLTKNIFQEVVRLNSNVITQSLFLNSKLCSVLLILIGLFMVNANVTIISMLTLGGSYALVYYAVKKILIRNSFEISRLTARGYRIVSEGLGGIKEFKLHGKEYVYVNQFDETMQDIAQYNSVSSVIPLAPRYFIEIVVFGGLVASIIFLIQQDGLVSDFLPTLSLFAIAGLRLIPALQQIFYSSTVIRANLSALDIIQNDLTDLKNIDPKQDDETSRLQLLESITLENLSFQYPNSQKPALANISLKISSNEVIGIVGMSGSGKSTFVDLFAGLITPTEGRILIDQTPLTEANVRAWQSNIGYVSQNIYLLDSSFNENIAFGVATDKIDMDRVRESAKLASLDHFIMTRPEGYNSSVGERGAQLSGGQRQRVGIARALYRDSRVLIFDEATSALDLATESEIMQTVEKLRKNRTIIIISHRPETIKMCDHIFVMEDGKFVSTGTYSELKSNCPYFQKTTWEKK